MGKRRVEKYEEESVPDLVDLFALAERSPETKSVLRQRSGSRRPEFVRLTDDFGEPVGQPVENVFGGSRKLPLTPDEVYGG